MYGVGGFGYESLCIIVSQPDVSFKEFHNRDRFKDLEVEQAKYLERTRPLFRKPRKMFDMYYLKDLSYIPSEN